jgi:D-beta-D-heptose 7-phosphate kinase/D-beta-D-heptose 1-phosphate adenosyltransferase
MRIVVTGEACDDVFIYGDCKRLCPEGPVPVFTPQEQHRYNGMAANTRDNMSNICSDDDDLSGWFHPYQKRATKTRYVDRTSNQILLRVDENDEFEPICERGKARFNHKDIDLLVVSDYNKGLLTDQDLIDITSRSKLSILDTKRKLNQAIIDAYDFIKLNSVEFHRNIKLLRLCNNMEKIIVTLGAKGVQHMDAVYPPPVVRQTFDVSGAGDVFTAGFAYSFATSGSVVESINKAQDFCSQTIQKRGTCIYEKGMG